jgi:hypothetical protein
VLASPGPCASAPGSPALTQPANELVADRPTSLSADRLGFYIRSDHLCNHTYDGNVPVA